VLFRIERSHGLTGVVIEDPRTVSLHPDARIVTAPGFNVILKRGCVIESGAVVIADKTDCVLSDSYVGTGARIRDSVISGVHAGPGSQVLETTMAPRRTDARPDFRVTLGAGFDCSEEHFAFTRGAVVKRIRNWAPEGNLVVPTGHSLISREEFQGLRSVAGREIEASPTGGVAVCINAQYAHPEEFEQFYDPRRFGGAVFQLYAPAAMPAEVPWFDLRTISKARAKTEREELRKIQEIFRASLSCAKMVFVDSRSGTIVVERR
jgi:hypothetical protein